MTDAAAAGDLDEALVWSLMTRFERLAIELYARHAPAVLTDAKRRFVGALAASADGEARLAATPLGQPVAALLDLARSRDETATLVVQGLVLEHLGQAIYRLVRDTERPLSDASRRLAAEGLEASEAVAAAAGRTFAARGDSGDVLYGAFAGASLEVIGALDGLAEPVDEVFGERFGLVFADVMGEFTADLVGACTALGMPRRKVVAHLAGAAMGIG